MTDVQGFHTTITLGSDTLTLFCNSVSISRDKSVMEKSTMDGTGVPQLLVGQATGTVSLEGQVDTVGQALMEATFLAGVPTVMTIEVSDGATIDAGTYSGDVIINSFHVEATADDTWNFTLDATGYLAYTAPA